MTNDGEPATAAIAATIATMGQEMLALPLGASLAGFGVVALVSHAFVALTTLTSSAFKRYTAKQMMIALLVMIVSALTSGVKAAARVAAGVLRWWLVAVMASACFSFLYVTYTEYPSVWLGAARFYNGNVGPLLNYTVVIPLYIADVLLQGLLPIWNAVWWFVKTMLAQGVLPIMVNEIRTVLQMATTLLSLAEHLAGSLLAFVTGFLCHGAECLHPERGVLDLLSPMGDVREFVALGVKLLRQMCSTLAAPVDLLAFPLMDLNLAEGVHHLGNAAVQLLIVVPRTTAVRCALAQGTAAQFGVLMCTPDLAPAFHFLAAGLSALGQAVDNWANVAFLIVQSVLSSTDAAPPRVECDPAESGMIPDLVAEDAVFRPGARPVVVGLTDWLYAVTDGVTAVYMGHNDPGQAKMQAWPHPGMDVGLGVAAVTYSSVHDLDVSAFSSGRTAGSMQTTAMLACNCTDDQALGARILCSILPMTGVPAEAALDDYLVQTLFPDTEAGRLYTCDWVDIYVKSVRWSYTRYASEDATLGATGERTTLPTGDCIARGTCRELDATVWVVPRCGREVQATSLGCIPTAPCFPFCMAARAAGSGRDNLMLASATRWREGLTILGQDCAMATAQPGTVGAGMGVRGNVSWTTTANTGAAPPRRVGNGVFASTYAKQECQRAPRVMSVVDRADGPPGSRAAAANVRLAGQPFAITGDTTLMEVGVQGLGDVLAMSGSVQVERLMGSEVDAFSLHPLAQTLPSLQRVLVPMSEAERTDSSRVTVPYSYGTTRIAATSSRNYVFYASNPSLDVFGAYFEFCARKDSDDGEALARMGLLAVSSFAPMRIYRVAAYRRCATYSCGADLVRFATIEGFDERFDRECGAEFNVSVVGLEYLNEDNIAVMLQSSHVREYDAGTLAFRGPRTRVRTYWLNPASMALRATIWQTAVPSSGFAVLCPSLQRLPRVGTFAMELANAGVFLLKTVVGAVVYTPGMVAVWRAGGACPPVGGAASYHSVLGGCGSGLYSLDDFFDSMDDAAAVFWHGLARIGKLVASTGGPLERAAGPLSRVMDGTSQYGEAMIDLWSARASVMTLTRVPVKEQVQALWASMQPAEEGGTRQQGLAYGSSALSGWSRFSYKAVSTVAVGVARRALDTTAPPLTAARVFEMIWADVYDLKDEFEATITQKNRMGCAGLRLIFASGDGSSNPWADLVYHQCVAAAELTEGLMMGLGVNTFVLIPMAKCVCKDSRGADVGRYVVETCAPRLPTSLLPTLFTIANEARALQATEGYEALQCAGVLGHVKGQIGGALDAWFASQHLGLQALGAAVDYATSAFDPKGGKCTDFLGDPHVVVLVPQPVDYFARCAGTSMCKGVGGKCWPEWASFQGALAEEAAAPTRQTVSVAIESAFFPGAETDQSLALAGALALVEVPSAQGMCLARARTVPPDYALAVAELVGGGLRVQYWCAPLISSSGVYRSEAADGGYGPVALPGTVMSAQFGDDTGRWLAALVQLVADGGQGVFLVNRTGVFATPPLAERLGPMQALMRVENLWAVEGGVLVDVVTRRLVATGSAATTMELDTLSEAVQLFLVPPLGEAETNVSVRGRWHGAADASLMQFGGGAYMYTRVMPPGGHTYLFVPRAGSAAITMHRLTLSLQSGGPKTLWLRVEETEELGVAGADMSLLEVMAAASQSTGYILSTASEGSNWLRQTRLDTAGGGASVAGVYGSASIRNRVTIEGRCDEMGCEGCATLTTQRLCLAYGQCALTRCVGTLVHQARPLCGVGGLLQHWGEMALKSTHGSWTIFTEMLGLTLDLSLLTLREAYLLWPDDSFLCSVCQAKDATAQFFSILTATVNSALLLGDANVAYMYGGATNVDTNAEAALTISATALNGFMHQAALLPLYILVASRQVMMCQVNGVLALVDSEGFTLSLRPADKSSAADVIAGQCLTVGAEVLANYPGDSPSSVAATVATIASNAAQLLLIQQIEPALHGLDAALAYVIGVVHALGVLVMAHSMARCNPPTFNLGDVMQCACGDHRLQIPAPARDQGVAEGALWCTGVLSMMDGNSEPYLVYNKYTYAQLQAMSSGLDEYARCLGAGTGGYKCPPPTPPAAGDAQFFSQQGVTVANVLVKCRENYAKKQWDRSAYVLYNREYHHLFEGRLGYRVDIPEDDPFGIRACMQVSQTPTATGSLAQRCLEEFLRHPAVGIRAEDYWAYERVDAGPGKNGSQYTDACLVFSGPADIGTPLFAECVDGGDADGTRPACRLAGHAWSPLSENQVPVAEQHRVLSRGVHLDGLVQRLYAEARRKVLDAVDASIRLQGDAGSSHIDMQFFSVEGDVLHQIMDCMFMGPYSRMDYWPIPACTDPAEECLTGPYWARDAEGLGGSRGVDPDTCPTLPTLPYTCGSPARQAAMRYLVLNVLPAGGGDTTSAAAGSVVHETVMSTLLEIRRDWNDTGGFGCLCAALNTSTHSPACCVGGSQLLPDRLNKTHIPIDSAKVLQAMEDDLGNMYRLALEDPDPWRYYLDRVAPGEASKYARWNESRRVQDEARFDPTRPVASYTSAEEALEPLKTEETMLWDVCHAALKQTFFTLPVAKGASGQVVFDPELAAFDGDPDKLQVYVRAFTHEAWRHSPLFRHYSPRHAPSDSHLCEHDAAPHVPPFDSGGTVSFSAFTQLGKTLLPSADLPDQIPAYPPQQFRVGATDACLCGWVREGQDLCRPPVQGATAIQVCSVPGMQCTGPPWKIAYHRSQEPLLLKHFSDKWVCPEVELSPHWGFMDPDATDAWLNTTQASPEQFVTSSRDLLRHGRAGLRIGNVWTMANGAAKTSLNPTQRRVPLEHGRLTTCKPPPPLDPTDAARELVDELFPAAQAAEEGGVAAYCLRYVIELARLEVLGLLPNATGEAALQEERVLVWRRRCGAQLHLLHLCTNLGVYRPRLVPRAITGCPHFAVPEPRTHHFYVTRECLLGAADGPDASATRAFYDPCRCVPCAGDPRAVLDTGFVLRTEGCRLRFDPRSMVVPPWAAIGWVDGQHPLPEPAATLLPSPHELARRLMDLPDAVGNTDTQGPGWWRAEGWMNGSESEFCDGVLDWWPEEWSYPVGYHVTVPCDANDTAYRSFAQAFALDDAGVDGTPTLVYQHDLLRDARMADSHFGVGGLCRRGSFGMPLLETNTMRYCTSIPLPDKEDFAVPGVRAPPAEGAEGWTPMRCAPTSRDLPWPDHSQKPGAGYESSLYSVGTVPHMPREGDATYPASNQAMSEVGPWQEIVPGGTGWAMNDARRCQNFALALCTGETSCPAGFLCRGMVCSGDPARRCKSSGECPGTQTCGGVCLEVKSHECVRHSDCADPRDMCTGVAQCKRPLLVVQNRLEGRGDSEALAEEENDISVALATGPASTSAQQACGTGARAYSLVGGSYWGNTGQDLLRVHGMCSFENWFKYTDYYGGEAARGGCATSTEDGALRVDPRQCSILNLERHMQNQSKWWPPGAKRPELMYLRPTNCDRDHERLQGFTQCAPEPGTARVRFAGNAETSATRYNAFVRLHTMVNGTPAVLLADMPERNDTRFGALGLGGMIAQVSDLEQDRDVHPYVPCALIGQCFAPPFTVDALPANRTFADAYGRRAPYPDTTVFKCGVFGLEDPGQLGCRLDTEVLPLYRALCLPEAAGGVRECKDILSSRSATVCENIRERYQPTNLDRTTNLRGLKELFYSFPAFTTIEEYLGVTGCMGRVHASIRARAVARTVSKGLYFPFMFVLKELPFDWFYQCIVMGGLRVNEETWRGQDCVAYKERARHPPSAEYHSVSEGGDSMQTYLRYVRGGFTLGAYEAFRADGARRTVAAVRAARQTVQAAMFPRAAGRDESYPVCAQNLVWKIGPYGGDFSAEFRHDEQQRSIIVNWFDPQQCRTTWHTSLVEALPNSMGITSANWVERLSAPDPAHLEPQSSVSRTLLDLIQAHMLQGMGMRTAERVLTGDMGVLYYDNAAPDMYDEVSSPIPRELYPAPSFQQGVVYVDADESTSRTCAYRADMDPAFFGRDLADCEVVPPDASGITGRADSLKRCGGVMCTNVPVLARKGGQFHCRYEAEGGVLLAGGCTQDNAQECTPALLARVYAKILEAYRLSDVGKETAAARLATTALPWFEPTALFRGGDWSFDLATELDYERNIQPNPELSVMCDITTTAQSRVQFMECTSPHFAALKQHANRHYRREGAVVVPAGGQLEWRVDRGVLERGVILSYTRAKRQLNQTYMDALFEEQTVCKGVVQGTQRVCWKRGELEFESVNPWLMGNFNPFEVCDVDFTDTGEGGVEFVYAQCLKEGSPSGRCERFLDKPVPKRCEPLNRKRVSFPGVPRAVGGSHLQYNLCFHRLEEDADGCMHDQGLLGGYDGSPVATGGEDVTMIAGSKYETAGETYRGSSSLYEEAEWSIPDDFRKGFYAFGRNPLWHGETAPYGHLQVDPADIGGHRIGVVVERSSPEDSISAMAVERLPMGTPATDTGLLDGPAQQASRPTREWVPGLQPAMAAEDAEAWRQHVPRESVERLGASCPLQRWTYYSGGYQGFSPEIPSALRAQHLFHGVHGGRLSHPTMVRAPRGEFLGRYLSTNGFCACPVVPDIDQPQCRVPSDAAAGRVCSLAQTIRALQGGAQVWDSHVFAPLDIARATRRCEMQLDWPAVSGTLRDGSVHEGDWTKASSPTHKECHVLDRLRPFRYQYRASTEPRLRTEETLVSPGATTNDAGVCQTARVVTLRRGALPAGATRCLRQSAYTPEDEGTTFVCDVPGTTGSRMPRRPRLNKEETLERLRSRRQKCHQCAPPPRFKTAKGGSLPPESSFGRLYRHSPERMLAKDLQDVLRRDEPGVRLNASAWTPGEFMRNYLFAPHHLFVPPASSEKKTATPPMPTPADDAEPVWSSRPWVYCPTRTALRTGEGCQGTMTRGDWVRHKTTLCPQMVRSFSTAAEGGREKDPMARTPFCSLDNSTDLVCKALEEAKALVTQANCIARGDDGCMPSPYVYHPASYVPSNNAWVHDSVQAFYIKIDPASCPAITGAEGADRKARQLLDFARQYQQTCPANSLVLIKQILVAVRVIVTEVALIVTSLLSMFFKMLSLLVSGNVNNIKNMVLSDWQYVRAKGSAMVSTVSDLLFDALLNSGPMGERIRRFLQGTCEKINSAMLWFTKVWYVPPLPLPPLATWLPGYLVTWLPGYLVTW